MPVGASNASWGTWASNTHANAVRWAYANADGVLISKPGRIYAARLVPADAAGVDLVVVLRDGTAVGAAPILALCVTGKRPDDWPTIPVSMGFKTGLYAQFFGGTAAQRLLLVGWETD